MADVFISYKREDSGRVRKLVEALRATELTVWWDEDIPASAPWEQTIECELAEAKAVVVCWSPTAVVSENVRSEARRAREDGRLIQLFIEPCEPPLFFGERQGIDLSRWRGNASDRKILRLVDAVREVGEGRHPRIVLPSVRRFDKRIVAAMAGVVLLIGSLVGWLLFSPAKASGPTTLAVVPFRALNPSDANLVDAIWDDTRGALSRNPNLRVLGRQAVEKLSENEAAPGDYRRKLKAQYLLDASVQHVRDQVQMKLNLVRTEDGAQVWTGQIGGKLDDVFVFQTRIANAVEGLIRGRVAPGGGVTTRNIATSGEVYSLFADARAKARQRDPKNIQDAISLLKKAVALDPNYAPAWAELGAVTGLGLSRTPTVSVDRQEQQAVAYLKRALQLAPNLAHAHAALAMVQNLPPESESDLRKAVELDPNDAEAWNWLANLYLLQNRLSDALVARRRAAEIDPFWRLNTISTLVMLKDEEGVKEEMARIAAMDDPPLLLKAQWIAAQNRNQPAEAIRTLLQLRRHYPEEAAWVDARISRSLIELGFVDEALSAWNLSPEVAPKYRETPDLPGKIRASYRRPIDFWLDDDAPASFGRLLPSHGRLSEYIGYYDAAFSSPDELIELFRHRPMIFASLVPTIAVNLRKVGRKAEAETLIRQARASVERRVRNGPATSDLLAQLAQYRALDGRDDEAVALLGRAVADGWLPDRQFTAVDVAKEPCFARLTDRPKFQALRHRILARIEEERRRVPLRMLAEAYPAPAKAAA